MQRATKMIDTGFCNGQTKSVHSGYCKRLMPEQASWWMDGVNSKPTSTPSTKTCSNPWVASTICPTITEIQTAMGTSVQIFPKTGACAIRILPPPRPSARAESLSSFLLSAHTLSQKSWIQTTSRLYTTIRSENHLRNHTDVRYEMLNCRM